jgi:hypothetical protein
MPCTFGDAIQITKTKKDIMKKVFFIFVWLIVIFTALKEYHMEGKVANPIDLKIKDP